MAPISNEELFWLAQYNSCLNSNDLAILIRVLRQVRNALELASYEDTVIKLQGIDFDISASIRAQLSCQIAQAPSSTQSLMNISSKLNPSCAA